MAIVKARGYWAGMFALLVSFQAVGGTTSPPEVAAAAPDGTQLIFFKPSGDQADAAAVAVYETPPDADDVRHRTLIIFGRKDGKFVPEVTNDKVIACSKCSQFHDDPFNPKYADDYVDVASAHIHMEQMDGGERPSTTTLDFVRRKGRWFVKEAMRELIAAGRYETSTEKLPIPRSGLVRDMDGRWSVPTYLKAIIVNDSTGKFAFIREASSQAALEKRAASECVGKECRILLQQQDGCVSLARDSDGRSFGAGDPNPEGRVTGSKGEVAAASKALELCAAGGGGGCKVIRTECTRGVL